MSLFCVNLDFNKIHAYSLCSLKDALQKIEGNFWSSVLFFHFKHLFCCPTHDFRVVLMKQSLATSNCLRYGLRWIIHSVTRGECEECTSSTVDKSLDLLIPTKPNETLRLMLSSNHSLTLKLWFNLVQRNKCRTCFYFYLIQKEHHKL